MTQGNTSYLLMQEATRLLSLGTPSAEQLPGERPDVWEQRLASEDADWWDAVDRWIQSSSDKLLAVHAVILASQAREAMFADQYRVLRAASKREGYLQTHLKSLAVDLLQAARELAAQTAGLDSYQQAVDRRAELKADMDLQDERKDSEALKKAKAAWNAQTRFVRDLNRVELPEGRSARLQNNPTSYRVEIYDPDLIPDRFWVRSLDTGAVTAAFKSGAPVPGVTIHMTQGEHVRWGT